MTVDLLCQRLVKSSKALFYTIVFLDTGIQVLVLFWQVIQSESLCPQSEDVQLTNWVHYISTFVVLLPERKLMERKDSAQGKSEGEHYQGTRSGEKKGGGGEGAGGRSVWESIVNGILLPPLLEMGMMIKGL